MINAINQIEFGSNEFQIYKKINLGANQFMCHTIKYNQVSDLNLHKNDKKN